MSRALKTVIFRAKDCDDGTLRHALMGIDGAQIVAEVTEDDDLANSVNQNRPDILMLLFGHSAQRAVLDQVAALIKSKRDLSVILAGPDRDPDLLLSAMRSGVREFVQLPTDSEALIEVLQKILEVLPTRQSGSLIVVHGSGGGCGTSTVACNLAVEITQSGAGRVALVDLDLYRGQLAAMLDVFPTYTMLDVCRLDNDDLDHGRLDSALLKHDSGVRLLARPKELLPQDLGVLARIVDVVHGLIEMFDYVVLDFDLQTDLSDGRLVKMSDEFLLVCQPVIPAVRNASEVIRDLETMKFDTDRVRLVLNRVPKKPGSVRIENVEKSLKRNVFWEIPEDSACVSESLNLGIPLSEHATSSKVRCALRDMATAVMRPQATEITGGGKKGSLFQRMFKSNVA